MSTNNPSGPGMLGKLRNLVQVVLKSVFGITPIAGGVFISGKLGIGTNSPLASLDVPGSVRIGTSTIGGGFQHIGPASGTVVLNAIGGPGESFVFGNAANGQKGIFVTANTGASVIGFLSGNYANSPDAACVRLGPSVIAVTDGTATGKGWLQNSAELAELTADVTESAGTLKNLTDLTLTPIAGRKYVKGELCLKCNNSVAAEGIQLDFNGGTATWTSFWAGANIQSTSGTDTPGTTIITSIAGVINYTLLTGETIIIVKFRGICNAGGTLIPRVAENSHVSGTLTVELGSWITMSDCSN